jgi:hypothetical protein
MKATIIALLIAAAGMAGVCLAQNSTSSAGTGVTGTTTNAMGNTTNATNSGY